jgi:Flp pilus assembly pilin Flp
MSIVDQREIHSAAEGIVNFSRLSEVGNWQSRFAPSRGSYALCGVQVGKDSQLAKAEPRERQQNPMPKLETYLAIDSDVTPIEYALIVTLIALSIVVAVQLFGAQVDTMFTEIGAVLR